MSSHPELLEAVYYWKKTKSRYTWPQFSVKLNFCGRQACQTLSTSLDISNATARVAPDLIKILTITSDTTARRSAVDWEDLKPYWKLEIRLHFSRWSTILPLPSFSKFFKRITERRLTEQEFLAVYFFLTFLKTKTPDETSGEQDSFKHILKRSANIHKVQSHISSEPPLE